MIPAKVVIQFTMTLKVTTAQVVETSIIVKNSTPGEIALHLTN